ELGLDSIKLLLSGDDNFTPNGSQELAYDEDEVAAAGDEARKQDIWLACHARAAAAVKLGLKYGFLCFTIAATPMPKRSICWKRRSPRFSSRRRWGWRMARSMPIRRSTYPSRSSSAATRSWRSSVRWCPS